MFSYLQDLLFQGLVIAIAVGVGLGLIALLTRVGR